MIPAYFTSSYLPQLDFSRQSLASSQSNNYVLGKTHTKIIVFFGQPFGYPFRAHPPPQTLDFHILSFNVHFFLWWIKASFLSKKTNI